MTDDRSERAWRAAGAVCDPEIPVLSVVDLGILRDVRVDGDAVRVEITPTYSGCPAMNVIGFEIETALRAAGFSEVLVTTVLSPAWTTDWMSADGRRKLREIGIAPPPGGGRRALFGEVRACCPRCGSDVTEEISEFGTTACKALWRCRACREPFDLFKCH